MKSIVLLLAVIAFATDIPRTWETTAVDSMELPLANRQFSPVHIDKLHTTVFPSASYTSPIPFMRLGVSQRDTWSG